MAISKRAPRVRSAASTLTGGRRLTRSAPDSVKAREFASRRRLSLGASVRGGGVGKELASLEIEAPRSSNSKSRAGGGSRRYELRGGNKGVTKSVGVAQPSSTGWMTAVKDYLGPGYQKRGAVRTVADGRECLICAETQRG